MTRNIKPLQRDWVETRVMSSSVGPSPLPHSVCLLLATSNISRHMNTRDKKKRKRISQRVRGLEKTAKSLSHELILALTELQNRTTAAHGRKANNSGIVNALSTALSGLSTGVEHYDNTPGTSAPDATPLCPSEQPNQTTTRPKSVSQHKENDSSISSVMIGLLSPDSSSPSWISWRVLKSIDSSSGQRHTLDSGVPNSLICSGWQITFSTCMEGL
ncbi:hypothetical protein V8E53_009865 [Lactarius tabidus]